MTFRYRRRYTGKLRGAIFDWAGTTIDYGCFAPTRVFMEGFAAHGVDITLAEARAPMGKAKRDHIAEIMNMPRITTAWQEAHGVLPTDDDVQKIYEAFLPRQIAVVGDYADIIPGTIEMVSALRERGMVIGSCTGYTRAIMEAVIPVAKQNGYEPDCIITSDEVSQARPAPWMALKIAEQMRIYPFEAWVKVGDTVADIEEGINAGMWTVGISKTGNELGLDLATVASLAQDDLVSRLQPIERKLRQAGAHFVIEDIAGVVTVVDKINTLIEMGYTPSSY